MAYSLKSTIQRFQLFGPAQFAYTHDYSSRDAVLFMVTSWLLALSSGKRIGLYCSDVSGAFDNVCSRLLLRKLVNYFSPNLLRTLASWLDERSANICINGAQSNEFPMCNLVFQDTVLGPWLWNLFFSDAQSMVRLFDFESIIFADDLNTLRYFPNHVHDKPVLEELDHMQSRLHA